MIIEYKINFPITAFQFKELLNKSTLGKRRPIDDIDCLKGMVKNSNLIITAWDEQNLVGIARSLTDFNYACYLSDLAVDENYQHMGIGKKLLSITQERLGVNCRIILIAAPAANKYYEHLGFTNNLRCWILNREQKIKN